MRIFPTKQTATDPPVFNAASEENKEAETGLEEIEEKENCELSSCRK